VGTVWTCVAHAGRAAAKKHVFMGDRQWIRTLSVVNALDEMRTAIIKEEADR
jgi:nicotinamide mononucleotide (NMN) deamidase PncC